MKSDGDGRGGLVVQCMGDIALNGLYCSPHNQLALARNMREAAARLGPCDLRIGNLEAMLWGDGGVNLLKVPRLCTSVDAATALLPLGLDVALLANNHAYDCLEPGHLNTVAFLAAHGIKHVGAGLTPEAAAAPLIVERDGRRVGVLNYVSADTHPNIPPGAGVSVNMLDPQRLLADVRALAGRVDVTLVNLHWGVDLLGYPTVEDRRLARQAIEAGATVVVGHHAHCLQGHEPWKHGHIFYGLGEFLFDEVDYTRPAPDTCRRGAVAFCRIEGGRVVDAGLTHIYRRGLLVEFDDRPCRRAEEERLNRPLGLPDDRYQRFWKRRRLHQGLVTAPMRLLRDAGGPLQAVRLLRWRHAVRLFHLLTGTGDRR